MGLEFVEFVMGVEDEFGVKIPDDVLIQLETMGDWHSFLIKLLPDSPPDEVWERLLNIVCQQMGFNADARSKISSTDRLIQDLNLS